MLKPAHKIVQAMASHGVDFDPATLQVQESVGDCFACGKERHLYVNGVKGVWHCKVCGESGNLYGFLRHAHERYISQATRSALSALSQDRGLPIEAFTGKPLGIGYCPDTKRFFLPHYNAKGTIVDLRSYRPGSRLVSTAGGHLSLYLLPELLKADVNNPVYICEGEWDAIALRWLLSRPRIPNGYVVAAPGAETFREDWVEFFQGRRVVLCYDNDGAGERGERRVWNLLEGTTASLGAIHWPPKLPDGFDVRDFVVSEAVRRKSPRSAWQRLCLLTKNRPRLELGRKIPAEKGSVTAEQVREVYRKWLYMGEEVGDIDVLDVVFGAVLANRIPGDPLWLFVVAPSGGAKSEIIMSLRGCSYVVSTSSFTTRAMISGARSVAGQDLSWIPQLDDKVLVIKDFTPTLTMHSVARDEIFSMLRDAYDGLAERRYGTGEHKSYKARFGIVAGVTAAIHAYHTMHASLGERFIRFDVNEPEAKDTDDEKIWRALGNIKREELMREELRRVAGLSLNSPSKLTPLVPEDISRRLVALARYTALLRGVVAKDPYSGELKYIPQPEIGTRLAKQLAKLGMGIALWRREKEASEDVYRILVRVARSTIPDKVEAVVRTLWRECKKEEEALGRIELMQETRLPSTTLFRLLEDMHLLGIIRQVGGSAKVFRWRLTDQVVNWIIRAGVYEVGA